ncbi:MAG: serine hydrolase [Bryobacterales bacterium]|nr:serine hydrolase [Bryobacterales bacterium]
MRLFIGLMFASLLGSQPANFNLGQLDTILEESVSSVNRGVSLTLVVDGQTVYRKSFGLYETDRVVRIASASKWLAAATILAVVDEGKLTLNDRADRYVRQLDAEKGAITLRQLLSHTSGLVPDASCLFSTSMSLAACVDEITAEPLLFAPGTRFYYGNTSLQVAARMAEVAAGKPWATLFQEKLATPLEFRCTRVDGVGSLANPAVANGVVSCASDYSNFLAMIAGAGLYKTRRVLTAGSIKEMTRDQTGGVPIQQTLYRPFASLDPNLPLMRYGLGVWREQTDAVGNALEVSSQGAFGFSPWVDFPRHLTGVLSVESSQDAIMGTYLELKRAIRAAIPVWSQRPVLPTNAASYTFEALAPGSIIALFGNAITRAEPKTLRLTSPTQVARELDGLRVLFDGVPAPLIYSDWSQISTVVPYEMEGRTTVTVQVEQNGEPGPRSVIGIADGSPALFTVGAAGRGQAAAVNEDGTYNTAASAVPRGSIIILFATGLGVTTPRVATGEVPTAAAQTATPVRVSIGGLDSQVLYAGVSPGSIAGLYQLNVRVPPQVSPGSAVPVSVQAGTGRSTAVVTIAVR